MQSPLPTGPAQASTSTSPSLAARACALSASTALSRTSRTSSARKALRRLVQGPGRQQAIRAPVEVEVQGTSRCPSRFKPAIRPNASSPVHRTRRRILLILSHERSADRDAARYRIRSQNQERRGSRSFADGRLHLIRSERGSSGRRHARIHTEARAGPGETHVRATQLGPKQRRGGSVPPRSMIWSASYHDCRAVHDDDPVRRPRSRSREARSSASVRASSRDVVSSSKSTSGSASRARRLRCAGADRQVTGCRLRPPRCPVRCRRSSAGKRATPPGHRLR
jgi:hypothetical protein